METHTNPQFQNPNMPLNSPSTTQTLDPNSPSQTRVFSDFDTYSPLSTGTTPNHSPDPTYSFQDDPATQGLSSNIAPPLSAFSSVYSWSQPWSHTWEMENLQATNNTSWDSYEPKTTSSSSWTDWPKTTSSSGDQYEFLDCVNCEVEDVSAVVPADDKLAIVGAGFSNLGNTCFLNSILQCFIHTVPLFQELLTFDHKVLCSAESLCVFRALCELIELSLTSTGRSVSPWKFVDYLSYFSSSFQRFQQEDAHEFLQCFLDRLESCCNGLRPLISVSPEGHNFVKQVFGGRLVSKLKCCNCGHCSDTYEPSIDLSLEIEDADNLISALDSFTKVERIEDPDTQFTCENCKEKVSIEKQLLLDQAPSISAFHLKRFKNDGSFVEKIDKFVEFPLELDMLPYTGCSDANDEELKYYLYAVVVHIGFSSTSGHYYCFVRLSPDAWYKFDDSKVVRVREDYVLSQEAYILFYARNGTPWFSEFIDTQKQFVERSLLNTSPKSVLDSVDTYSLSSTVINSNGCDVKKVLPSIDPSAHNYSGLGTNKIDVIETKDDLVKMDLVKTDLHPSASSTPLACHTDHVVSPSVLRESNSNQQFGTVKGVANVTSRIPNVTPKARAPPRSVSPEIYRKDSPDIVYSIPRGHLKSAEKISCKRQLNKELDSMERKQACSLIKKSIPGSRGQQLMAAVRGSHSEGSINKKRSRMEAPANGEKYSTGGHRSSTGTGAPILAAASSFR